MKSSWAILTAVPWMVRGWKEERQAKNEKKAVERYMEKKRKLEERIAKQAEADNEKGKEAEGSGEGASQ